MAIKVDSAYATLHYSGHKLKIKLILRSIKRGDQALISISKIMKFYAQRSEILGKVSLILFAVSQYPMWTLLKLNQFTVLCISLPFMVYRFLQVHYAHSE